MKIIIDECVPSIVKRIPDREIVSVQDMGWAGIENGELLRLVATEFDVFVTSDKNLRYQQNLSNLDLTIVLLPSNQVPVVRSLLPKIDAALERRTSNDFIEIEP